MLKYCYKCKEDKSLDLFGKNSNKKDGLATECRSCKRQGDKDYYQHNANKVKKTVSEYRLNNAEKVKQVKKDWYENNKSHVRTTSAIWAKCNPIKIQESAKKYRNANRDKRNALISRYRATKIQATPAWFESDLVKIVYKKAKEWGFEVDHIVPLRGKTVCGLHCWSNLQLLDKSLNSGKRHYYWPDMP